MTTSIMSLLAEKNVFGFKTNVFLLISLALIKFTCSGPRLMLGNQILEKPIDYSLYSGKLAKQTSEVMECVILKTVDRDFRLWPQERWLISQLLIPTHDTEYCPNLVPMQKQCSQIKSYQYRSIIRSFSNRYRTVWTVPRPSLPTGYQPPSSPEENSLPTRPQKPSRDSIQRSIGRTPVIMPTMERNSNSSSTMKAVNGRGLTTSSTTGGLRKQRLD